VRAPELPHEWERFALAVLVPLTVWVASAHWVGWLIGVPLAFLALNVLPFLLACRTPASQWRGWLLLFSVWAWFHLGSGAPVAWFAWLWLAIAVANTASAIVVSALRPAGRPGIAARMLLAIVLHAAAVGAGFAFGWMWAFAGGAVIAGCFCAVVLRPSSQCLGPVVTESGCEGVVLTIDDGPHPGDTPALLDLLDRHEAKAVFFLIGENAARHPELAEEIVRRGHAIGNHTMTHPHATFWCRGPRATRREIEACQQVLQRITGIAPRWFRAPVGHRNLWTHPIATAAGLRVMAWSRRGYDGVETAPSKVLARILPKLGPGDIVLLHEGTRAAVEVLEGVLMAMREKGLRTVLPG
jgi:peptidoglycan/xylan/chitin deacetylase (PgdA/CDA1 family)